MGIYYRTIAGDVLLPIGYAATSPIPELVRKLVLTGTGPRGGKDMDKVAGVTSWDTLRARLIRSDPKEFLFFNRDAAGKRAGKVREPAQGTHHRSRQGYQDQCLSDPTEGDQGLRSVEAVGSVEDHPAHLDRQRRP